MSGGTSSLSQRIRELRQRMRLKQKELGQRLDVSANAVSLWERDSMPTLDNLRRLAEVGSVTLDWLIEGRDRFLERLNSMSNEELETVRDYLEVMMKLRAERESKGNAAQGAKDYEI